MNKFNNKKASILVIAIWVLVFLSILSVGLYQVVSSQLRLAKTLETRLLSRYLARAACNYAKIERKKDSSRYDSLAELSQKREKSLGRGKFIYSYIDEESKLNINTASPEMISRLPGLNQELAQAIAESTLKPYSLKEEILLVEGINSAIYNGLKDLITVYTDGKININTAPAGVLLALGLNADLIQGIKDFRLGKDNLEFTDDDGIFENTAEILNKLHLFGIGLTAAEEAILNQLINQGIFTTSSKNFSLLIDTEILNKPALKHLIIIGQDKIKLWQEY